MQPLSAGERRKLFPRQLGQLVATALLAVILRHQWGQRELWQAEGSLAAGQWELYNAELVYQKDRNGRHRLWLFPGAAALATVHFMVRRDDRTGNVCRVETGIRVLVTISPFAHGLSGAQAVHLLQQLTHRAIVNPLKGALPMTGAVITEDVVLQPLEPGFTKYHLASGKDAPAFLEGAATCAAHLTIGGKLTFKDIPPHPFLYSSGSITMLPVVRLPSLAYGAAPSDPPVAVTAAGELELLVDVLSEACAPLQLYDGLALEKALMEELRDLKKPKTVMQAARKLVAGLNNSVALILHCHTAVLKQAHKLPYALVTPPESDPEPVRRQRAKLASIIDHYAGKLWDVASSLWLALSATAVCALSAVRIFPHALCCVLDITELFRNLCEHFTGKDRTVTKTTEPAVRTLLRLKADSSSSSTPLTQTHMDSLLLHIPELKRWYHAAVVPAMATCGCALWDNLTTNLRQWTCSEFRARDPLSVEGSVITINLPGRRQLPGGISDLPCLHLTGRNFAAPATPYHKQKAALRRHTISHAAPSTPPHKQKAVPSTSSLAAASSSSPLPATPLGQQQPEEAAAYTPSTAGSYMYRGDAASSPASPYEAYQPAGKKSRAVVITGCNQLLLAAAKFTASRGLLDGLPGLQTAAAAFIDAVQEADADTALSVGCDLIGTMQAQLLVQATEARLAAAHQLCEGLPTQVSKLNLQWQQAYNLERQQLQLARLIGQCSAKYNTEQETQQLQQQAESTFVDLHEEVQLLRQDLAAAESSGAQLQHLVKLLHAVDVEIAGLLSQLQSALVKPSHPRQAVKAVGERVAGQVVAMQSLLTSMPCIRLQQQANLITPLLQRDDVLEAMLRELREPGGSCIWIDEASMVSSKLDAAYEAFSSQDAAARAELQALPTSRAEAAYKKQHAKSLAKPSSLTVALDAAAAVDMGPLQQAVSLLSTAVDAAQARAKLQADRSAAGTPKSRLPVALLRLGRVLENTKQQQLSLRNKHQQARQKHIDAKVYWDRR